MRAIRVSVLLGGEVVAVLTLRPGEKVTALELERPTSFDQVELEAVEEK